jgi:SAM-dependent methyltransferase
MAWFFRRKKGRVQTSDSSDLSAILSTTMVHEQYVGSRRFVDGQDAPYQLPKDTTDLNRLDFQHFVLRQSLGGNYIAPISPGPDSKILDVGTGTGRWAIEMAQAFPQAQVFGVDLEEARDITGKKQEVPANYHFQMSNILQGLPFLDNTFDFVHQRLLVTGIPVVSWPTVAQELMRVTKPGGWVEMVEGGGLFVNDGPATRQWCAWGDALMKPAGIDIFHIAELGSVVEQTGLATESRIYNIPVGSWGGRLGAMLQQDLLSIFDSLVPRYHKVLGLTPTNTDMVREMLIKEWDDLRTRLSMFVVIGQKPA